MYKSQIENLENYEFHKICDNSGIGVKKSRKGFIVLNKSNYQGDHSDVKILIPYSSRTMQKCEYTESTDLYAQHNDFCTVGEYIATVALDYFKSRETSEIKILSKGYRVG